MTNTETPQTTASIEEFNQIDEMLAKMKTTAQKAVKHLEKTIAEKNAELTKCGRVCHEEASAKISGFLKQERDNHRKTLFNSFEIASLLNTFADAPKVSTNSDGEIKVAWGNLRVGFDPLRYTEPLELFMAIGLTDDQIEKFAEDAATSYGCVKRGANAKELHNRAKGLATELLALDGQKNNITKRMRSLLVTSNERPDEIMKPRVVGDFLMLPPNPNESKITVTHP